MGGDPDAGARNHRGGQTDGVLKADEK